MTVKPNSASLSLAFALGDICNLEKKKIAIPNWNSEGTAIQLCAAADADTGSSKDCREGGPHLQTSPDKYAA